LGLATDAKGALMIVVLLTAAVLAVGAMVTWAVIALERRVLG
jgi:hypothetical protein